MPQISADPFADYDLGPFFCELTRDRPEDAGAPAAVRARIATIGLDALRARAAAAENDLFNLGITFTIYSDANAIDRIFPFDCIPRILTAPEWRIIETGVQQRVAALNAFLHDIYHKRRILTDGIVPAELVLGNPNYRPEMEDFPVRFGTYVHICGTDIVRDLAGNFMVLEDNARTPSGVSYVIENRHLMSRAFPDLMAGMRLRPVDDYGPAAERDGRDRARRHRRPPGRAAVARHLQLGLFRARVPVPRDGGAPRRGRRPVRRGRQGLDAHHRRQAPGPHHLPPHRRRLPRPDGGAAGKPAGGGRPDRRVAPRQRRAGQRGRHRGRRRQGGLCLHAAHHPLLPRRGPDPVERRDPYLPRGARGWPSPSTVWTSW